MRGFDARARVLLLLLGLSMAAGTPYTRTLNRAMQALGGEEELAAALGVALEDLRSWVNGESIPPVEIFNAALDIVASGRRRPPRKDEGERKDS